MPKKKSLWARDCKCLVCENEMFNYQYMAKSQTVVLDEWMVPHTHPVGEYEDFPNTLKTTICPACLMSSNEYGLGVDKYIYFTRNMARNTRLQEFYSGFTNERFAYLCENFERFEEEAAEYDQKKGKPNRMRTRQTLEKVWQLGGDYPKQYFKLLFEAPRDLATAIVLMAMDRHTQMTRIAYEYDLEPASMDFATVRQRVCEHYDENTLDMKMGDPRFYFTAMNYMVCWGMLKELAEQLYGGDMERYEELRKEYLGEAFRWFRYSHNNDDISAIPLELKDGGLHLMIALLYRETGSEDVEQMQTHLRGAKRYADNALKRISNNNQQNFVNQVDALWSEVMEVEEEGEGEGEGESAK